MWLVRVPHFTPESAVADQGRVGSLGPPHDQIIWRVGKKSTNVARVFIWRHLYERKGPNSGTGVTDWRLFLDGSLFFEFRLLRWFRFRRSDSERNPPVGRSIDLSRRRSAPLLHGFSARIVLAGIDFAIDAHSIYRLFNNGDRCWRGFPWKCPNGLFV